MPRSNWKGFISFGLVSIPVVLFPTQDKSADISFHQIDKHNNARIKYQRINSVTGKVVDWSDIIKGYEYDKETIIPVPEEVLNKIAGESGRTIEIKQFITKKELDLITIDRSYFVEPGKNGEKGYVILREALIEAGKIGIAKVIISTKEYLAAIMPYGENALSLCLLKYDMEMRKIDELDIPKKAMAAYKVNKTEINIAKQLITSMTSKWKPEKYVDEYQQTLHQWVEEAATKSPHHTSKKTKTKPSTNVVSFVDLLRKSLTSKSKENKPMKTAKHVPKAKAKVGRHATKH
jgi:DNA end-binding protein Ku